MSYSPVPAEETVSSQPDLHHRKTDGTVLQTYNSGSIARTAQPTWRQFGFLRHTGWRFQISCCAFSTSPGGCGNDLALDDPSVPAVPRSRLQAPTLRATAWSPVRTRPGFCIQRRNFGVSNNPAFRMAGESEWRQLDRYPRRERDELYQELRFHRNAGFICLHMWDGRSRQSQFSQMPGLSSTSITITIAANPVTTVGGNAPL